MVFLAAAMMAVTPLMPRLWLLAAVWLAMGAASGGLDVGGNTLLVWVHGRQVGPFMNGLHFFFGVGAFLSPLLVALAASLGGGITWSYWTLALLALPAGAWLLRLASPPAPQDGEDGAAGPASPWLVALLALFLLLYVGAESAFGGWIYTYAVAQGLGGGAAAAYLTSAFWGSLTVGRLLTIPLAIRFRPLPILIGSLAGCLASAGAVLLWPGSLVAVWSGTLGMGLGMAAIFPTTMALAERRMTITGRVTGWFLAGSSVGGMSLPWLIGQLFEPVGPWVMAGIILAAMAAATAVLGIFTLRTAREARY
jgi:FHS family Na+ dependent glucose MFS transporter 1